MEKLENTVSYTAEEIDAAIARGEDRTDWEYVKSLTPEQVEASIDFEDEGTFDWSTARVGFPSPKQQLTVRLDGDVVSYFKAQGPGYQTRMNAVLRAYVEAMTSEKR